MIGFNKYCKEYRVGIWECPPFIFSLMGVLTIVAILATYFVGITYTDPMWVVVIACGVTIIFLILSYIIVMSFERIANTSKQRAEFIGIMSHQLRNPLVAIKWQLSMVKTGEGPEVSCDEIIRSVEEQNKRMIKIVNDLLEVNRFEDGTPVFMLSNFSFIDLIKSIVDESGKDAREGIEWELSFPEEDIVITADKGKIKCVVSHLVDNAYVYSPNGGKISIIVENMDKYVRFSVKDEGLGISDDERKYIFKKFFRGNNSKKYRTDGLGVGLYLVKSMIESMGGTVGFTSTEGSGSSFWFVLPVVVTKAPESKGD